MPTKSRYDAARKKKAAQSERLTQQFAQAIDNLVARHITAYDAARQVSEPVVWTASAHDIPIREQAARAQRATANEASMPYPEIRSTAPPPPLPVVFEEIFKALVEADDAVTTVGNQIGLFLPSGPRGDQPRSPADGVGPVTSMINLIREKAVEINIKTTQLRSRFI